MSPPCKMISSHTCWCETCTGISVFLFTRWPTIACPYLGLLVFNDILPSRVWYVLVFHVTSNIYFITTRVPNSRQGVPLSRIKMHPPEILSVKWKPCPLNFYNNPKMVTWINLNPIWVLLWQLLSYHKHDMYKIANTILFARIIFLNKPFEYMTLDVGGHILQRHPLWYMDDDTYSYNETTFHITACLFQGNKYT